MELSLKAMTTAFARITWQPPHGSCPRRSDRMHAMLRQEMTGNATSFVTANGGGEARSGGRVQPRAFPPRQARSLTQVRRVLRAGRADPSQLTSGPTTGCGKPILS